MDKEKRRSRERERERGRGGEGGKYNDLHRRVDIGNDNVK